MTKNAIVIQKSRHEPLLTLSQVIEITFRYHATLHPLTGRDGVIGKCKATRQRKDKANAKEEEGSSNFKRKRKPSQNQQLDTGGKRKCREDVQHGGPSGLHETPPDRPRATSVEPSASQVLPHRTRSPFVDQADPEPHHQQTPTPLVELPDHHDLVRHNPSRLRSLQPIRSPLVSPEVPVRQTQTPLVNRPSPGKTIRHSPSVMGSPERFPTPSVVQPAPQVPRLYTASPSVNQAPPELTASDDGFLEQQTPTVERSTLPTPPSLSATATLIPPLPSIQRLRHNPAAWADRAGIEFPFSARMLSWVSGIFTVIPWMTAKIVSVLLAFLSCPRPS
jgi:hypothetical protein